MPTGYTADIENDISFEDYALSCARAFGACMHQRESPSKEKPKLRTGSDYHANALSEAKKTIAELEAMAGVNDRTNYGKKIIEAEEASNQKSFNKKIVLKNKYDAMLIKVYNWHPPTSEHEQLKNFMIDQIVDTVKYDCDTKYDMDRLTQLSKANPLDKYKEALRYAYKNAEYHETELMKSRDQDQDANRWISVLYNSLGVEYDSE